VFRTYCSNVRIPRSHRITFGFPFERMYSAARSHSSTVADNPRFKKTGFLTLPTSFNKVKFCILRAPIWRMSMWLQIRSTSRGSRTSVQVVMP